jgi:FkbM family methyltransferase
MQKRLRDDDVLYDVGANVGVYSLIAAAIAPKARIVAFEPGYANFAALCDNISLNGATTIAPLPIVLGESTRSATLAYSDVSAGSARHVVDGTGSYEQPILVHTIDLLVGMFGVPAPTLVKLDVDGAEAAVLSGAANALARPQLRSLIVEIEDALSEDVCGLLTRAGFTLGERFDTRDGERLPGVWYGIFER